MYRRSVLPAMVFAGLLMAAQAAAQDAKGQAPVPPPPGIDDPGVQAVPPPATTSQLPPSAAKAVAGAHAVPPSGNETDALGEPPPTVNVRKVGPNTVEEYRINGRLYMIHVVPEHGIPQTYMTHPDGHLYRQSGQPPVSPVFYTIYTWDKPPKPAGSDSDSGN